MCDYMCGCVINYMCGTVITYVDVDMISISVITSVDVYSHAIL